MRAEYDRQKALLDREVISQREFDAANAAFASAEAKEKDAAERLALLRKGPRKEQVEAARARALQARKALDLAETQLGYAELRSPVTGVVLSKAAEPGEVLPAGAPVVTAADLSTVWVRAYVEETDLGRVKLGQQASVTVDAFPGKSFPGRVAFISSEAEFTPRAVQTKGERVKLVYRVKVDVANPDMDLKPGMPADVAIETAAR